MKFFGWSPETTILFLWFVCWSMPGIFSLYPDYGYGYGGSGGGFHYYDEGDEEEEYEPLDYRVVATGINLPYESFSIPLDVNTPDGSTFGGISGLAYDDERDVYYALSDDEQPHHVTSAPTKHPSLQPSVMPSISSTPSISTVPTGEGLPTVSSSPTTTPSGVPSNQPSTSPTNLPVYHPRVYTIQIGTYYFNIIRVTYLKDELGVRYEAGAFKPEAIAYHDNTLYIAHEGGFRFSPGVWEYDLYSGNKRSEFSLPYFFEFRYDYSNNDSKAFKSLTINRQGNKLWVATERGLVNDDYTYVRVTELDIRSRTAQRQYVYKTDFGLLELISLDDNGSFLALEDGGRLFYALLLDALNVQQIETLDDSSNNNYSNNYGDSGDYDDQILPYSLMMHKTFLNSLQGSKFQAMAIKFKTWDYGSSDFSEEATSFDLVVMTDNDFERPTEIITTNVLVDTSIGIAFPLEETEATNYYSQDAANDPAIWIHPYDTTESLIVAALLHGGLGVYNLHGEFLGRRSGYYHSVDIIYAFKLRDHSFIDVAVATGGSDETLSVWMIVPYSPYLVDITSGGSIATRGNAYDIATYTSPYTSMIYAFVSHGYEIEQIELYDDRTGYGYYPYSNEYGHEYIEGTRANRIINVNGRVEGLVVDREMGHVYVSVDNQQRIIKFDAEPDELSGNSYKEVANTIDLGSAYLKGLTLYYTGYREGYLIVSVESDSTFAVFERSGDNDYVGSFTIGKQGSIDKTDSTQGIDAINVNLGAYFECGAFIVQDADNGSTSIPNRKANFKLVPFDSVSDALQEYLHIDAKENWDPRRFVLTIWIDKLSQEVYAAQKDDEISGRDAEYLLETLAKAAFYLYSPASKKRQMMEPLYHTKKKRKNDRSNSRRLKSSRSSGHRCSNASWDEKREACDSALLMFISLLEDLRAGGRLQEISDKTYSEWLDIANSIRSNLPGEYSSHSSPSSSSDYW